MRPTPCRSARAARCRGVTLLEMIIVISITAVLAGIVAVFISRPVESYADATRRAELTDIADTALRRMTRDLRTALPNSIRTTNVGAVLYLEFLPTSGGGRYRAQATDAGAGNAMDFTSASTGVFDVIGPVPTLNAGDSIVLYNLNASGNIANAYFGDNRRAYSPPVAGSTITVTPATPFPFASPGKRFQVVREPVTYECNPNAGVRQLRRYWGYAIDPAQPTPPAAGSNALLASDIAACSFIYEPGGASGRTGIVHLELRVERAIDSGLELIRLFQQVHVSNAP
jgi:MSHA biogenesis protein MshO